MKLTSHNNQHTIVYSKKTIRSNFFHGTLLLVSGLVGIVVLMYEIFPGTPIIRDKSIFLIMIGFGLITIIPGLLILSSRKNKINFNNKNLSMNKRHFFGRYFSKYILEWRDVLDVVSLKDLTKTENLPLEYSKVIKKSVRHVGELHKNKYEILIIKYRKHTTQDFYGFLDKKSQNSQIQEIVALMISR